ncbi:LysR family transcriptional regulator [Sandarakinorhabdus sp.]|uniref:LysR family transcriptional regulator n=1 Tax=Sandarakinorhabdus sp. TaxID=1916663 RepID=UPI00286E51CE|nr:LysR family transcriptional regulator [Sandarakinorhabdus sp.]
MSGLNYNHLRYFRAIAHAGSLTRAAGILNLSQSALSVQVKALETQLGHTLFDRVGRRMVLTEAGRIALDHADRAFAAGDQLLRTLAGRPGIDQQVLRVGALPTLSRNFQLNFVAPLVGRRDVELILISGTMRELLARLEAHEIDVVLSNLPVRQDSHSDLQSWRLSQQPVSLVAPPGVADADFRFPQSLADIPVLLPSHASDIRPAFDQMMERAGVVPIILAEVDDMAMLRLMARESEALTLVPPIVVTDELRDGSLIEVHRIAGLTEQFHAIIQRRRFPNPLLAALLPAAGPPAEAQLSP